jgi:hypothetical protein
MTWFETQGGGVIIVVNAVEASIDSCSFFNCTALASGNHSQAYAGALLLSQSGGNLPPNATLSDCHFDGCSASNDSPLAVSQPPERRPRPASA